jgi:hypothetical protein
MADTTSLNTPVLWVNKYLQAKLANTVGIGVPLFPSVPSSIDDLTENFVLINPDTLTPSQVQQYGFEGVMATWDRMFRMRRKPFPHIKCEQILYYFYATEENAVPNMIQVLEEVLRLLDRGDESAEEVNDWCSNRQIRLNENEDPINNMFYFHNFKVYQLEEVRDIIDFGTARTYAGNKVIIDFDYHQMPGLTNNEWAPEPKPANKIII